MRLPAVGAPGEPLRFGVRLGREAVEQCWRRGGHIQGAARFSQCRLPLPCTLPPAHCRDELKRHYNLGEYWIEVEMEDLASFDEDLADFLYKQPTEHLQLVSGTPSLRPPGPALLQSLTACSFLFSSWRKLPRRWPTR